MFSLQSVFLKRFFHSERKGLVWVTAGTSNDIPGPPVQLDLLLAESYTSPQRMKRLGVIVLQRKTLNPFSRAEEAITQFKQVIRKCDRKTPPPPVIKEIGQEQIVGVAAD